MKIIFQQINSKYKRQNKNQHEVPIDRKILPEETWIFKLYQHKKTKYCRHHTQNKTLVWQMKCVFEKEIEKKMGGGTQKNSR
ncbi:MAG: hypothetical protein MI685_13000 [Chlorobiales bacterium]|nr:hypothetical protein [Chlorobiales bacterium]